MSCHGCASGRKARSDDEPSSLPLTLLSKISKMGKDPLTVDSSKADPVMCVIASRNMNSGVRRCEQVNVLRMGTTASHFFWAGSRTTRTLICWALRQSKSRWPSTASNPSSLRLHCAEWLLSLITFHLCFWCDWGHRAWTCSAKRRRHQ